MSLSLPEYVVGTRPDVVAPSQIVVDEGDRRRADEAHVALMQADLAFQGLLQPLLLVERPAGLLLVDGLQRLKAVRALRWNAVDVRVMPAQTTDDEVRFAKIMANIDRRELTKLERAEYVADLHDVWQRLDVSARYGGDLRGSATRSVRDREIKDLGQSAILALAEDIAESVGLSRRAYFRDVAIARKIQDKSKRLIRGTWLENHQANLLELTKIENGDEQLRVCEFLTSEPRSANTVADAITLAAGGELAPVAKKRADRFDGTWSRMKAEDQAQFVIEHFQAIVKIIRENGLPI